MSSMDISLSINLNMYCAMFVLIPIKLLRYVSVNLSTFDEKEKSLILIFFSFFRHIVE